MEMNNTDFSMEDFNKFADMIKAGSPVHKINFTIESPNAIAGMYLASMENITDYLDKIMDRENVTDNTLLVFESRHVVECCQIIYGCLTVLNGIGMYRMKHEAFIAEILETLLTKPLFYPTAMKELESLTSNCIRIIENSNISEMVYKGFIYIMKNIWFIPYGKIDEIAREAINEFKKQCGEGELNE